MPTQSKNLIGTRFPKTALYTLVDGKPHATSLAEWAAGRRVVLFTLPGAFTPTCTAQHLPDYIAHAQAIRQKGIAAIGCMAVNDVFVLGAWGKVNKAIPGISMLADSEGVVTRALGIGLGPGPTRPPILGRQRAARTAFIADDGVITHFFRDAAGEYRLSSAEHLLQQL